MKIRFRITLWITLAGILSSLVLSLIIFFEMEGESHELLDQELDASAGSLIKNLKISPQGTLTFGGILDDFSTPYWIRIYDKQRRVLYESDLVHKMDLPFKKIGKAYSVNTNIPMNQIVPGKEEDESAGFRVKIFSFQLRGQDYLLQIARPVENLVIEAIEQLITIVLGLGISAVFLILVSYFISGRILQPIRKINRTAREINEETLDTRIPLSKNHDELYELGFSLNEMFDRLHYSFLRQKEFIANASHELKTPITMLRLSLEEAQQDEGLTESQLQRLEAQNKTLLRMQRLVNNLLDLSVLELSETHSTEKFIFGELINSVVGDFEPLLQQTKIFLSAQVDENIEVTADKEKIKRMLINLFDNAVKYNYENGEIKLQVHAVKKSRNVTILLFNTGPGIPSEDIEKVFDQFYRVEKSRSTSLGGAGLGLTIVKRIVELHGGNISIKSKPGMWTQIDITLPIR